MSFILLSYLITRLCNFLNTLENHGQFGLLGFLAVLQKDNIVLHCQTFGMKDELSTPCGVLVVK